MPIYIKKSVSHVEKVVVFAFDDTFLLRGVRTYILIENVMQNCGSGLMTVLDQWVRNPI